MRIEITTLFPEMCEAVLSESIIGRARKAGAIEVHCRNIRDYTLDKHRRVDDKPFGGGMGMVMQAEPIWRCWQAACEELGHRPYTIYLSPQGRTLTQGIACELAEKAEDPSLFLLCGHYEGVDQRILDRIVDEEISVGDYVLTGGELPALVPRRPARRSRLRGREPLLRPPRISPVHPPGDLGGRGRARGAALGASSEHRKMAKR